MILDSASSVHLKPWLVRTLEPICDAEPGALADYILALLKHNVPEAEMRKDLKVQLDEFLENECPSFIDALFNVLRSKSYLPYSDVSPPGPSTSTQSNVGIPIPLDGLLAPSEPSDQGRGKKRSYQSDDREGRPSVKGPRLNADGQFSRYNHGQDRSTGAWGGMNGFGPEAEIFGQMASMAAQMGMHGFSNQRNGYQPPEQKRGICRDYHNNGFCARGATCKYSHGDDAVVPGMFAGLPAPFMFPGFSNPYGFPGSGGAYDPHEARMDMQPPGNRPPRAPLFQRQDGGVQSGFQTSGELPVIQDLTPTDPSQQTPSQTLDAESHINGVLQPQMGVDTGPNFNGDAGRRPVRASRGRGRGRGGNFGGEAQSFRPPKRDGKTLVVEKIPEDKLSLEQVKEWFKRFGTVTNVAIDGSHAKALISFSNHEEAFAAWKSEDAVFNNRFVKVFWHRPMEGQGQAGVKALAASAPLVAKITTQETSSAPVSQSVSSKKAAIDTSALAAQQSLLEQQIMEQKSLMASLSSASAEEKKEIMGRLRKLGEEMKKPSITAAVSRPGSVISNKSSEGMAKQTADNESDMQGGKEEGEESTEALKAKLEKLKAEAASLGIADNGTEPTIYGSTGGYRPYRGRGRSFRGYRGAVRGGPPRASMKLDNRPKKLLVKDVSTENTSAINAWFEATGQVDSFENSESGELVIGFRSRVAAEQALAKSSNIPDIGQINLTWYGGPTILPKSWQDDANKSLSSTLKDNEMQDVSPSHPDETLNISSRWGDEDGEDRM